MKLSERDVVVLNDFWIRRPKRATLIFEVDEHTGTWMMTISAKIVLKFTWQIGFIASEARKILHRLRIRNRGGVYKTENTDETVMIELGNEVEILIPRYIEPQFKIRFPLLCRKTAADMIFGRLGDELFYLHCRRGVWWFRSKKEMEEFVMRECPEYAVFSGLNKVSEGRYGIDTLRKILRSL